MSSSPRLFRTTVTVRVDGPDSHNAPSTTESSVTVAHWDLDGENMASLIYRALLAAGFDPQTAKECSE